MAQNKIEERLYRIRFVHKQLSIFDNPIYDEKWGLILKSFEDDYSLQREFEFVHPVDSGKKYIRHYTLPLNKHVALLRVGQYRTDNDYATVAINLAPEFCDEPYVILAGFIPAFQSADELARIVERAFNKVLEGSDVRVVLEYWDISAEDKAAMYKSDCVDACYLGFRSSDGNNLGDFGFEQLNAMKAKAVETKQQKVKKAKAKKEVEHIKSDNILDYIPENLNNGDKESLLMLLGDTVRGLKHPIDIMRSVCFLISHGIIARPTFPAFIKRYPFLEDHISESTYNRLITHRKVYYRDDDTQNRDLAKKFEAYM